MKRTIAVAAAAVLLAVLAQLRPGQGPRSPGNPAATGWEDLRDALASEPGTLEGALKGAREAAAKFKSGERRIQRGPILVIEKRDGPDDGEKDDIMSFYYMDATNVLVDSQDKKAFLQAVLQAVFPKEMGAGGPRPVGAPTIQTIDEHVASLKEGDASNQRKYPDAEKLSLPYEEIRAELKEQLGSNYALVLRYIHVNRGDGSAKPGASSR
jgi:hypothetical protein